ncbi:nucleotidyltransferase family protein [Chitinophaga arvensicola]|uniref:Molybdenum cofactor cytidylyltransferase n=1 Tax=Chitinophaga arvensicola TaxID=29529 RepID=A0A1I0SBX8_9BACT|nr:nucleotidyltransferase family protein [Chitinophaga arvensicola]SEW54366.1 molybdenum cofactor cytidylyltransferase [Chitinophaga arvensicola]
METTGIIILAAGASKRLGTPKQQLTFQNKSLLLNVVHTARESGNNIPVVVVLGAFATQIREQLVNEKVHTVVNPNWPAGMGGSIQTGLQQLRRIAPQVSNALLLLCDQPFITTNLLVEMYALKNTSGKAIVACSYGDSIGTPALFDKSFFPQLLALSGQEGAKKILLAHPDQVATVDFPQGAVDIDTSGDYEQLLTNS